MKKLIILAIMSFFSFELFAECIVNITRVPCPGKESIAYSKCDGKKSCDKVNDEIEEESNCLIWATKNCINKRYDVTRKKVNIGYFIDEDGNKKPLNGGADLCAKDNHDAGYSIFDDVKDKNIQKSFPYYNKPECK